MAAMRYRLMALEHISRICSADFPSEVRRSAPSRDLKGAPLSSRLPVILQAMLVLSCGWLSGCPGELENPECFPDQAAPRCTIPNFDPVAFFADRCGDSTCHAAGDRMNEFNNLDMVSDGLYERLTRQHASDPACADIPMIDEENWQNSFLARKLRGQQGSCGQTMPNFSRPLPEPEAQCIGRWLVLRGAPVDFEGEGCVDRADSGVRMDVGASEDAMSDAPTDSAGEMDAMSEDTGEMSVDCQPLRDASFMVCQESETGCEVKTETGMTCSAICAMAGLSCSRVVDDNPMACEPNLDGETWGCDEDTGHMHDYCFCEAS